MKRQPLYMGTKTKCDLCTLWTHTQESSMHQQWDLRFSEIKYLTKDNPTVVKKFLYSNKIGFGIKIHGIGKSVATRTKDNRELTSVLKFSSIKQGLGYWKYVPEKLLESGYIFRYPTLEPALKNILNNEQYIKSIFVSALLSTLFFLVALFFIHISNMTKSRLLN